MRFALAHAQQAPLHHLEGIRFQGDQPEEQPIFRCSSKAGLVHRQPVGGPALPIEAPRRHRRLERGLEG
jgi:hypothetical protein